MKFKVMRGRMLLARNSASGMSPSENVEVRVFTCNASGETRVGRRAGVSETDVVQSEGVLDIRIGGVATSALNCSFDHLAELAVGHLLTEGFIDSYADIQSVAIDVLDESKAVADVSLTQGRGALDRSRNAFRYITSSNARLSKKPDCADRPFEAVRWTASQVFSLAREFAEDKTSHAKTRGCHSAYLANGETILCIREDIGRHNAFDKAVGWALINGVDLSKCMLYTSGRVPSDMVSKAIRARVPVLISKSVTTNKAAELARHGGVVLLCEALPESFELICGSDPQPEIAVAQAT